MDTPEVGEDLPQSRFCGAAYPPAWRVAAAVMHCVSRAGLVAIFAMLFLATDPALSPPRLLRFLVLLVAVPGAAAWLIKKAYAATLVLRGADLVITLRGNRIEIPCASIARVIPWRLPLPGPGFVLSMRSGSVFTRSLQIGEPAAFLHDMAFSAHLRGSRDAAASTAIVYAEARRAWGMQRWYHAVAKYPIFALIPTVIFFRAHQYIAYGGPWGQYQWHGLRAYLESFAVHWTIVTTHLIVWGGFLRVVLEMVAYPAAWCAPSVAPALRRVVEAAWWILYVGGVAVVLGLRFAA